MLGILKEARQVQQQKIINLPGFLYMLEPYIYIICRSTASFSLFVPTLVAGIARALKQFDNIIYSCNKKLKPLFHV